MFQQDRTHAILASQNKKFNVFIDYYFNSEELLHNHPVPVKIK